MFFLEQKNLYPLSFEQERFWFLNQLNPGNPAYHERGAVRITGLLNVAALSQGINEIIRRHEILRTSFVLVDGQPSQKVAAPFKFGLSVIDLLSYSASSSWREKEAQRVATQVVQEPFDLSQLPLWRLCLLQIDEAEHLLVLSMHHIISDGDWSIGLFFRELALLYEAELNGQDGVLPKLAIQYKEFALWQRQQIKDEGLERSLTYWKAQLAGEVATLQLPIDRPRAARQHYNGAVQDLTLCKKVSQGLKQISKEAQVPLFVTLLAGFKTLLYRYTNQTDICVGAPAAGRPHADFDALIGYFGTPLVLRTDMSEAGQLSFRELLPRVFQVTTGALAHQYCPFEKVVTAVQPKRDMSLTPLFQVLFVFRDAPQWEVTQDVMPTMERAGLTITPVDVDSGVVPYDLCLFIKETTEGLVWRWEYNRDLFEEATIKRMLAHCQTLLSGLVAHPDQPLDTLSLIDDAERHQLLVAWNRTEALVPPVTVHQLFAEQVARTPNAVAVLHGKQYLTYRELNQQANQVAHYLRAQETFQANGDLIGLCVERDFEMVVGVLGILKSGAAYVPLDPAYPKERLQYMLENSGVRTLLTTQKVVTQFPELAEVAKEQQLLYLDTEWNAIAEHSAENPVTDKDPDATLERLVYVIYTSGSTGKPKGVAMRHRAMTNLIHWQLQNTVLARTARTLQFAPISFDVSFQDIFSTLCAGGTLVLLAEETRRDPQALLRFLTENKIERIFLPFVALQQLAEVTEKGPLPVSLREVITAGEQLQITPAITNWFKRLPNCTLHNHYGPTESHVITAFTLTGEVPADSWPALPPIGRPIGNAQTYILDQHLQPVPIGVPGELYLGGDCLARGYLNRPELTQERFIPNPFESLHIPPRLVPRSPEEPREGTGGGRGGARRGGRLYKTGDLARYLPDGNIQFLGRIDHQVKIRGFRVELGEIETVLTHHPTVRECVVMARQDLFGNKRLVAYIVQNDDHETVRNKPHDNHHSPSEPVTRQLDPQLHNYLSERLPEYMVPSTFVRLQALPLTPSGKINRRALPAPSSSRPELEMPLVLPQTENEALIAAVWQEALQLEVVGIHDNFFGLGGHSLLLTHIQRKLAELFSQELPIVTLFQNPTIHSLANLMAPAKAEPQTAKKKQEIASRRNRRASAKERRYGRRQARKRRG